MISGSEIFSTRETISTVIFYTALAGELIILILLTLSRYSASIKAWPPSPENNDSKAIMNGLFNMISVCIILLGIFEWPAATFPRPIRLVGAVLWLAGISLGALSMDVLGRSNTLGGRGGLVERGPYRFSRNPQYLGFMISLIGWGIFISSPKTIISCAAGIIPLLIIPMVEEPWLELVYGKENQSYKIKVPRWISLKLILKELS